MASDIARQCEQSLTSYSHCQKHLDDQLYQANSDFQSQFLGKVQTLCETIECGMQEDEDVRAMRKQTMLLIRKKALQDITTAQLNSSEFDYTAH